MIDLLHETKPQNAWIPLYVRTEVLVHIYQKALERNNFKVLVMKKKQKEERENPVISCYWCFGSRLWVILPNKGMDL